MPICVVATGNGSIEQFLAAHEVANDHNLWFHVDAAYGGTLVFSDTE
ncbi:pyridoxal-dependent decarboxylase [Natranaeroarchaeum aerophilus]